VAASLVLVSVATAGGIVLSRGRNDPQPARPVTVIPRPATHPASPAQAAANVPSLATFKLPRPSPVSPEYQGLLKRSLFARQQRSGSDSENAEKASHRPPRRAEADLVLRGVSLQEGKYTALVEDLPNHRVRPLHTGDAIGRGRLCKVTFDGVEYEANGEVTQVEIGEDLTGALSPVAVDDSPRRAAKAESPNGGKKKGKPPTAASSVKGEPVDEGGAEGEHAPVELRAGRLKLKEAAAD